MPDRNALMKTSSGAACLSFALLLIATTSAWATDMEMRCRPIYGIEDFRSERPEDVLGNIPSYTYYLFDNPELFHYRVQVANNSPQPITLGELDWPAELRMSIARDGELVRSEDISIELLRRTFTATHYFLQGERLVDVEFRRRANGWGSEPTREFDEMKEEEREVEGLPTELATYQTIGVEFAMRGPDGGPLPHGLYTVDFSSPALEIRCRREQLVVMRHPQTDLDVADDHLVRYFFHRARGELTAAGREVEMATKLAPNSLKAWYYRGAHAYAVNDIAVRLEAAERQQEILRRRGDGPVAESPAIQVLSREMVGKVEEFREQAQTVLNKDSGANHK